MEAQKSAVNNARNSAAYARVTAQQQARQRAMAAQKPAGAKGGCSCSSRSKRPLKQ